ncbi:hypothetical protein C8R45DRAFT_936631 [Mycena sanguinolenta]|nr:hypothetical protein C8R45DRAFT_936631 [Mycena sanguinolenta]
MPIFGILHTLLCIFLVSLHSGLLLGLTCPHDIQSPSFDTRNVAVDLILGITMHPGSPDTINVSYGPSLQFRGGHSSDSDEPAGPSSKHKLKSTKPPKPCKCMDKGKHKATDDDSDSKNGLRIMVGGKKGSKGMFVDEVIDLSVAPEFWPISQSHRVAFVVDVREAPQCLRGDRKLMTVDAYIKKQCQDAWIGPTRSRKRGLARVTILDEDREIPCRRSNLKCNGFFTCSLSSPDPLRGFERWDDSLDSATQDLISAPIWTSQIAESTDIAAVATHFYDSAINQHCKAKGDGQFPCGGHAVMRKYRTGKSNGKGYFIECSNWSNDGLDHRCMRIPSEVRESILQSLFRGEEITMDDGEVVEGDCSQIVHPSHLPRNKECPVPYWEIKNYTCLIGKLVEKDCRKYQSGRDGFADSLRVALVYSQETQATKLESLV